MTINFEFFKKDNLYQYLSKQFIPTALMYVLGIYLVRKIISPIYAVFVISGIVYYSYFLHIICHYIPEKYWFINIHSLHHTKNNIPKSLNIIIETIVNLGGFFGLFIFQRLLLYNKIIKFNLIPNILIFYGSILYTSYHIINYTLILSNLNKHSDKYNKTHEKHHITYNKNIHCNFGPDTLDHLFNTNCDETWEDYTIGLPNLLFCFLICNYIISRIY